MPPTARRLAAGPSRGHEPHVRRRRTAPCTRTPTSRGSTGSGRSSTAHVHPLPVRRRLARGPGHPPVRVRRLPAHRRPDVRRPACRLGVPVLPVRPRQAVLRGLGGLQAHRVAVPGRGAAPDDTTECDWSCASLRGADLSGLDLSGQRFREADLTDADLRECDLTGADLDRARLQSAKLRGADLRGASMDEVNWRASTSPAPGSTWCRPSQLPGRTAPSSRADAGAEVAAAQPSGGRASRGPVSTALRLRAARGAATASGEPAPTSKTPIYQPSGHRHQHRPRTPSAHQQGQHAEEPVRARRDEHQQAEQEQHPAAEHDGRRLPPPVLKKTLSWWPAVLGWTGRCPARCPRCPSPSAAPG